MAKFIKVTILYDDGSKELKLINMDDLHAFTKREDGYYIEYKETDPEDLSHWNNKIEEPGAVIVNALKADMAIITI